MFSDEDRKECCRMSKKFATILSIVIAIIALATAITGLMLYLEKKKKEDEEIQQYIDCAIQ